jgi:CHASE2 domain-containing sensor protein
MSENGHPVEQVDKPTTQDVSPRPAEGATPAAPPSPFTLRLRWWWAEVRQRLVENRASGAVAAVVTALFGLALWKAPVGHGFIHWSFDLPVLLGPQVVPEELIIVKLDEPSFIELKQAYPYWNRTNHAWLVNKLTADGARLVVFDVYFPESDPRPAEDAALAQAIQANGRVVLAGVESRFTPIPGVEVGITRQPPLEALRRVARGWGTSNVPLDDSPAVRRHHAGSEDIPSLPWVAAAALDAPVTRQPDMRFRKRWLRYYGTEGALPNISYYEALNRPPGFFKDKIVFIGGKPGTRFVREEADEFHTPYTHLGGPFMGGVEIQATTFLNLWRGDWLRRTPDAAEVLLLLAGGAALGFGFCLLRPVPGAVALLASVLLIAAVAFLLFWAQRVWFPWLLTVAVQLPCAWACGLVLHTQKLQREKTELEQRVATAAAASPLILAGSPSPGGSPGSAPPRAVLPVEVTEPGTTRMAPLVADHKLIRCVGEGAYGQVWLAQTVIGLYRAVKIVFRHKFKDAAPYEREFKGIQRYMPISLNHPGLVHIVHVGRNDAAGHFYYVMELGDDQFTGTNIDPEKYSPRNLSKDLKVRRKLPVADCVELSLALTEALDYLHRQNLIHRDIKPSNIIFVRDVPKFADIGLVTEVDRNREDVTYIGTEGYIAPEGPKSPASDIYSLGKVLYECAMGLDREQFPALPETLTERPDFDALMQLNEIIDKACARNVADRYQHAAAMRADLLRLNERMAVTRKA